MRNVLQAVIIAGCPGNWLQGRSSRGFTQAHPLITEKPVQSLHVNQSLRDFSFMWLVQIYSIFLFLLLKLIFHKEETISRQRLKCKVSVIKENCEIILRTLLREFQTRKRNNTSKIGCRGVLKIKRHDFKILTKGLNSWPMESRGQSVINLSACYNYGNKHFCINAN